MEPATDPVQAISLWQAWVAWAAADSTRLNDTLGWFSVLWWGRIGKLLQFIGGWTLLLEILGIEWVQQQALQFSPKVVFERVWKHVCGLWRFLGNSLFLLLSILGAEGPSTLPDAAELMFAARMRAAQAWLADPYLRPLLVSAAIFEAAFLAVDFAGEVPPFFRWFAAPGLPQLYYHCVLFPVRLLSIVPILMVLAMMLAAGITSAVVWPVVSPLAWILKRPMLERNAKAFSLTMLIVGFHFDLLAS